MALSGQTRQSDSIPPPPPKKKQQPHTHFIKEGGGGGGGGGLAKWQIYIKIFSYN